MKNHLKNCPFEAIKGYFQINNTRIATLEQENSQLKSRLAEVEATMFNLSRNMLDLMANNQMSDDRGMFIPPIMIHEIGNDVQILKGDVEQLGIQFSQVKTWNSEHSSENIKIQEEIKSLRSICQTVQLQLFSLVLRNSTGKSSSPSKRSSSSNPNTQGSTKL